MHAEDQDEVYGEYPANIANMPGAIKVDDVAHRPFLGQEAGKYLARFPEVQIRAQRLGKDLVAFASSHGKEIIVGVGVASALTTGVILYRHPVAGRRRRKRNRKKQANKS